MVLTRNLYPKRRIKPSRSHLLKKYYKSERKLIKTKNGSTLNFALKHGKFTSCDITLRETSINNKILRIPLEHYDFRVLRNINCDLSSSSFGRTIKRKRDPSFISDSQRPHKKIRINGSSLHETKSHLHNSISNHLSHSFTSTKTERYEDATTNKRVNQSKSFRKKQEQPPKTFDKSKFKIRLSSKNLKRYDKKGISKSKSIKQSARIIVQKALGNKVSLPSHTYYLKFQREKTISEGCLNYPFQKLVTDVKNLNLPSATWKIKVIIKQNKISAITFTNKQELERSVTFSSEIAAYKLRIDNKLACLLGSPETIDTPMDIEILLDIVETLDSSSPVIFYR